MSSVKKYIESSFESKRLLKEFDKSDVTEFVTELFNIIPSNFMLFSVNSPSYNDGDTDAAYTDISLDVSSVGYEYSDVRIFNIFGFDLGLPTKVLCMSVDEIMSERDVVESLRYLIGKDKFNNILVDAIFDKTSKYTLEKNPNFKENLLHKIESIVTDRDTDDYNEDESIDIEFNCRNNTLHVVINSNDCCHECNISYQNVVPTIDTDLVSDIVHDFVTECLGQDCYIFCFKSKDGHVDWSTEYK